MNFEMSFPWSLMRGVSPSSSDSLISAVSGAWLARRCSRCAVCAAACAVNIPRIMLSCDCRNPWSSARNCSSVIAMAVIVAVAVVVVVLLDQLATAVVVNTPTTNRAHATMKRGQCQEKVS